MLTFPKVREEHLELIMGWRSKSEVNAGMFTHVTYDMDAQRKWFRTVSTDPACRYWLISYGDRPIGVISLEQISWTYRRCSASYYVGEAEYRQLGGIVPLYLYNYVFGRLKLHKMFGEVLASNETVLRIHRMHGYREVGRYKDHVCRAGQFEDVVLVELLAETWFAQGRYRHFVAEFEE